MVEIQIKCTVKNRIKTNNGYTNHEYKYLSSYKESMKIVPHNTYFYPGTHQSYGCY